MTPSAIAMDIARAAVAQDLEQAGARECAAYVRAGAADDGEYVRFAAIGAEAAIQLGNLVAASRLKVLEAVGLRARVIIDEEWGSGSYDELVQEVEAALAKQEEALR